MGGLFVLLDSVYIYTVRWLAIAILLWWALPVSAQTHRKCKIYQYFGNDSKNKKLVCRQPFNGKGKIVKEIARGYYESRDSKGTDLIHEKKDGTHYFYYDDTLLVTSKLVLPNNEGTEVYQYFYNEKKLLVAETTNFSYDSVINLKRDEWLVTFDDGDTTFYSYDEYNRKTMCKEPGSTSYFEYDDNGRLSKDSSCHLFPSPWTVVGYYNYSSNIRVKYFYSDCNCIKWIKDYVLDNKKRVIDETYFMRENANEKIATTDERYEVKTRKSYSYYSTGKIKVIRSYNKNELTTTHIFEYE